jgi:hypothetical protein
MMFSTLRGQESFMDFLSREQNERFAEVNARLGLGPDEFTAELPPGDLAALPPVRMMSSTGDSHFPRIFVSIGSIEEMRKLLGHGEFVPPTEGTEPVYPVAPPQAEIDQILNAIRNNAKPQVSHELKERIEQAAIAYAVGDPDKVAAFVPLINALLYPGRVAAFTGQKLELPGGASHVIAGDDPVVLNYGQISVAAGATIKVNARTFISSQIFTRELGAAADQTYTIQNIGEPWNPSAAQQGGQGGTGPAQTGTGANGKSSYNGSNCQWECSTEPTNGPQGNAGLKGLIGSLGAKGHPSAGGNYNLGLITNPITRLIGGGDGQQGGKGGLGGPGGAGGAKGTAATGCANQPTDGPQGAGGQGGDGGPGGPGGDSGYVTAYYSYHGTGLGILVTVRTVAGGAGGQPGDPGPGTGNNGQGNIGTPPGTQGAVPQYGLNKS